MLKRLNWKVVFKCFAWIVCLGGVITLMSFVEVKKRTVTCTSIKILIPGADNFIEREEIDAILKQNEGTLIGRGLESVNLHDIEKKIVANPYIAQSKVYADMDGVIHIEISQRQPILRIINAGGQDYYIDRDGLKMPISPNFTADVLVANGHILEHFGGKVDTLITGMAADLYRTALFLKKDTLWDSQIEQIFVNNKDDIELVPRVGNQRIILGSADSLEKKMANLLVFYKKAMPQVGWDTYKTINIKYTNQIVCEKNKPDSVNRLPSTLTAAKSTKDVIDSLVNAQIAADLKNNPEAPEKEKEPEPAKKAVEVKTGLPKKKEPEKTVVTEKKKEPEQAKKIAGVKTELPKKKEPGKNEPEKKVVVEKKKETETVKPSLRKSWPPHAKEEPVKTTANNKTDTKKNK